MRAGWPAAVAAKVKAATVVAACLGAGAVGGTVALQHVAPLPRQGSPAGDHRSADGVGSPAPATSASDSPAPATTLNPAPSTAPAPARHDASARQPTSAPAAEPPAAAPRHRATTRNKATARPGAVPTRSAHAAQCPPDGTPHGHRVAATSHDAAAGKGHGDTVTATAHDNCATSADAGGNGGNGGNGHSGS